MKSLKTYYLEKLGIECWQKRPVLSKQKMMGALTAQISTCQRCPNHLTRKNTVSGSGNVNATLMVIGAFPNPEGDRLLAVKDQALFNNMLKIINLGEEAVYFTNLLKCRGKTETVNSASFMACESWLTAEIELIKPIFLFVLGEAAGQFLFNCTQSLNVMRGSLHYYKTIPTLVSFHPHDLRQNPSVKKLAFIDLLNLRQYVAV